MANLPYDSARWSGVQHSENLCGNDRTTFLHTPSAAVAANTTTKNVTCLPETFGRAVKLKRLLYIIDTATTAADATLSKMNLGVYVGTTSSGNLAVTTQAALAVVTSSELNVSVAATDYIRIISSAIHTASDLQAAIGMFKVVYEEEFTNV